MKLLFLKHNVFNSFLKKKYNTNFIMSICLKVVVLIFTEYNLHTYIFLIHRLKLVDFNKPFLFMTQACSITFNKYYLYIFNYLNKIAVLRNTRLPKFLYLSTLPRCSQNYCL